MFEPSQPIPSYLQELVDRELQHGERIRWIYHPIPPFFNRHGVWVALLLGGTWTACWVGIISLVWALRHTQRQPARMMDWIGLALAMPFMLLGIAVLLGPFWMHRRIKTVYVITNRRAIDFTITGFRHKSTRVESLPVEQFGEIKCVEEGGGSGCILISRRASGEGESDEDPVGEFGFYQIPDVKTAERMLRNLAEEAAAHSAAR